jgi:hypothetical protein
MARRRITIRLDEDEHFDIVGVYDDDGRKAFVFDMTPEQAIQVLSELAYKLVQSRIGSTMTND